MRKCKPEAVDIPGTLRKNGDRRMKLEEKLIYLRKKQGLTQQELAGELEVSRQAVSRWEMGQAVPNTDNLKVLSNLYGVTLDCLINDELDIVCSESDTASKQEKKPHCSKYVGLLVAAAILLILLMAVVTKTISLRKKQDVILPIEDLTSMEETKYPTYTFSIG